MRVEKIHAGGSSWGPLNDWKTLEDTVSLYTVGQEGRFQSRFKKVCISFWECFWSISGAICDAYTRQGGMLSADVDKGLLLFAQGI